jgi:4'-phosphopantetheinyl transferase
MTSMLIRKNVTIYSLSPKPGVDIWYCNISDIIALIFSHGNYHNFRTMGNKLFTPESFTVSFLSDGEIKTVNRYKSLKKQVEWISGRFLIKQMVMDIFDLKSLEQPDLTIAYHDQGAPFLPEFPDTCISLSHSGNMTAAAISSIPNQKIGLDIETIEKKPDVYFLKTAFTAKEIAGLNDTADSIFKHWTRKEAFLKYIQKGFNESLHHVEVLGEDIFYNKQKAPVFVYSLFIDSKVILSLVSDKDDSS